METAVTRRRDNLSLKGIMITITVIIVVKQCDRIEKWRGRGTTIERGYIDGVVENRRHATAVFIVRKRARPGNNEFRSRFKSEYYSW